MRHRLREFCVVCAIHSTCTARRSHSCDMLRKNFASSWRHVFPEKLEKRSYPKLQTTLGVDGRLAQRVRGAHHATRLTQTLLAPSPPRVLPDSPNYLFCTVAARAQDVSLSHPGLDGGRTAEEKSLVQHRRKELCQQRPREGGGQRAGGRMDVDRRTDAGRSGSLANRTLRKKRTGE